MIIFEKPKTLAVIILLIGIISIPLMYQELRRSEEPIKPEPTANLRQVLTKNILDGNLACEYTLELEKIACLAFQSAVGTVVGNLTQSTFDTYYDRISIDYAIEVMNVIGVFLPSGRYSLYSRVLGEEFVTPGVNCFDQGYGICGEHSWAFRELMSLMDVENRAVEFYYHDENSYYTHVTAEIFVGDRWHYFDTTWGAFYRLSDDPYDIASFEEVLASDDLSSIRKENQVNLWRQGTDNANLDPHDYISTDTSIVYGFDSGTILVHRRRFEENNINFQNLPEIPGDPIDDGSFEGIQYQMQSPPLNALALVTEIENCSNPQDAQVCLNDDCLVITGTEYTFYDVPANVSMHIRSESNACALMLREIDVTTAES